MAFNGSGTFSLISGNPVVTGTTISSTWANNTLSDIAGNGLSLCLTKDGQQTPTANIPFGGFRLTGVGNAVNAQDVVTATQIQNGALTQLNSVAGTDTITATTSPAISAYAAGQAFIGIAAGANTTTSVTLNVNGLGAKSVKKFGTNALAVGDIQSAMDLYYDGTQFQLLNPKFALGGTLVAIQIFTSSGTYNHTSGATKAIIRAVSGGGAGGGCPSVPGNEIGAAGGGSGGGYVEAAILYSNLASFDGTVVTIGAGGVGASGLTGGIGGTTSFGSYIIIPGGNGASVCNLFNNGVTGTAAVISGPNTNPPASPTISTVTVIEYNSGFVGTMGFVGYAGAPVAVSGFGGNSTMGTGGHGPSISGNGTAGTGFGSGGGGAFGYPNSGPFSGGNGAPGVMVIYEFA